MRPKVEAIKKLFSARPGNKLPPDLNVRVVFPFILFWTSVDLLHFASLEDICVPSRFFACRHLSAKPLLHVLELCSVLE